MKRDERTLGENLAERINAVEPQLLPNRDSRLPVTQRGSREPVQPTIEGDNAAVNTLSSAWQPPNADDFQPPKRILAKLLATPDSCLPTVGLNITDNLTSWGRGFKNTIRFANGNETRFPKYAFKILLFKPSFFNTAGQTKRERSTHDVLYLLQGYLRH